MPYKNRDDYNSMRKTQYNRRKAFLDAYKRNEGCVICGETDPVVLDFHHLSKDDKSFGIATWNSNRMPIDKLFREVLKCTVLCANDHRRLHAGMVSVADR